MSQIEGLKRPFQEKELREALQGSEGKGRRDITWLWLNRIKSVCFVEFDHEREAVAARIELYDLKWPERSHTPGRLQITFTTREDANRTVAEEPVGTIRDPISARLGHIPGVGGLPPRDTGGGMRGWGSLSDVSAGPRGGGGGRGMGARLGSIGGVSGFGTSSSRSSFEPGGGGGGAAAAAAAGRGWGSLAAAGAGPSPRGGAGMGMFAGEVHRGGGQFGSRESERGVAGGGAKGVREVPVRLEDLFHKTQTKPEIYWIPNPAHVRERRLAQLKEAGAGAENGRGGDGRQQGRGG